MKKKMISLALAATFVVGTAGIGVARYIKCEVKDVKGETVTLDCGSHAKDLEAGAKVKVKGEKKKAAIEGC